jgi:hypothetical protein
MYGWSWSDTTGWIRLNSCAGYDEATSANTGCSTGGQYAVTLDETTGNMAGYAWSSNLGWISFGSNSCGTTPRAVAVTSAGGIVSKYNLTGAAQVVSFSGSNSSQNGGWNGCIYLDSSSMPSNPCNSVFGVSFIGTPVSAPTSYDGGGFAWGAGGLANASNNCAAAANIANAWGGLSWIRFDGIMSSSRSRITPRSNTPEVTLAQAGVFNGQCNENTTVTLRWTAKNSVSCKWTAGPGAGTSTGITLLPNGALSTGTATFTVGKNTGTNFALECKNATNPLPVTGTKTVTTLAGICPECSDDADNDGNGQKDEGDLSCHYEDAGNTNQRCKMTDRYHPEGGPESQSNCVNTGVCLPTDPGYPACKNRGIPKVIEN